MLVLVLVLGESCAVWRFSTKHGMSSHGCQLGEFDLAGQSSSALASHRHFVVLFCAVLWALHSHLPSTRSFCTHLSQIPAHSPPPSPNCCPLWAKGPVELSASSFSPSPWGVYPTVLIMAEGLPLKLQSWC